MFDHRSMAIEELEMITLWRLNQIYFWLTQGDARSGRKSFGRSWI